jgi:NAD(P)-dependent dehydrogenase (short-subunit alcohol dehydrogenase family)
MRILMTGATSGFGLFAAERLLDEGHHLTVGVRRPMDLPVALQGRVDALPLDLDQLESVRRFAEVAHGGGRFDALLLNAGVQLAKPATSADGYERTFAVNHLAHYLLLRLFADHLVPGARVVLTASGTHDPAEDTPVTPPVHANAEWLAYPDRDPDPETAVRKAMFRAYSSSKLANIMTAREATKRYPGLAVMAYDPGYVPWTGLGRANGRVIATLVSLILPLMMARDKSSTVRRSGAFLARLATEAHPAQSRGHYWAVRGRQLVNIAPSELARDDAACAALWDDSARLVHLGGKGLGLGQGKRSGKGRSAA